MNLHVAALIPSIGSNKVLSKALYCLAFEDWIYVVRNWDTVYLATLTFRLLRIVADKSAV